MTLDYLKELGVISALFNEVEAKDETISVSAVENGGLADKPVIADKPAFVAIKSSESLATASEVLASDGNTIYLWNKKNNELIYKILKDQYLVTIKKIKLKAKENKKMANGFENFGDLGMSDLNEFGMGAEQAPAAAPAAPVGGGVVATDAVKVNTKFINFCKRYGKFQAFITKNDAAVKVTKRQVRQLGADGKPVLNENATDADRENYNSGKSVRQAALVTNPEIVFKESKPSPVVGGILTVPQGAIASNDFISDLCDGREVNFDDKNVDTKTILTNLDRIMEIIFTMFGGAIAEDPEIAGEKGGKIIVEMKETKKKKAKDANATDVTSDKPVFKRVMSAVRHEAVVKNPITPYNYIPLSLYETVSQQALDEKTAKALNIAIEAVIKDSATYDNLTSASKKAIKWNPDDPDCMVSSDYFKTGAPCTPVQVTRFSDKLSADDVMFPIREKGVNKEGKTTYKYVTHKIDDAAGPLSRPQFADILKKTGMTSEDFKEAVLKITKKRSSKSKVETWSLDKYIQATNSGNSDYTVDRINNDELFEVLTGIA